MIPVYMTKTGFSLKIFNEGFEILRKMNNKELATHIRPFSEIDIENFHSAAILHTKLFLLYRKYLKIYRAYELCNKFGW